MVISFHLDVSLRMKCSCCQFSGFRIEAKRCREFADELLIIVRERRVWDSVRNYPVVEEDAGDLSRPYICFWYRSCLFNVPVCHDDDKLDTGFGP